MDNLPNEGKPDTAPQSIEVFRKNVLVLMEEKGLNKGELARRAGVGPDMLYKFFQGRSASFDTIEAGKIAACLGTTVDILLGQHNPKAMRALALIERLDPVEKEIVLRQIEALVSGAGD